MLVKKLGCQEYSVIWHAMQNFTQERTANTADELWLVEHPPVFTLGLAGRSEHILDAHDIPVIHCDRGGQVTYHGPGQIVIYILVDLHKRSEGIRHLVCQIEKAVVQFLADYNIPAELKNNAPGVYVTGKKIASLGLRVRRGCTYHGLSFNFNMDLTPFTYINPCGYANLTMTQFSEFVSDVPRRLVEEQLIKHLKAQLKL